MKPSPSLQEALKSWSPWGLGAIHAIVFLCLVNARYATDAIPTLAFLLSQCAAITLICSSRSLHPLARYAGPFIGGMICWDGIRRLLFWSHGESLATWWAVLIGSLVLSTGLLFHLLGLSWQQPGTAPVGSAEQGDATRELGEPGHLTFRRRIRFPITSLLAWTTIVAVALALVRFGEQSGIWSTESLVGLEAIAMAAIGCVFGILAAACFATSTRPNLKATLVAAAALPCGAAVAGILCDWIAESAALKNSDNPYQVILLMETFSASLVVTLLAMRCLARWGSESTALSPTPDQVSANDRRLTESLQLTEPSQRDAR